MGMKYYVDSEGRYLGGWDANPPTGAIEVPEPPQDARQIWDGRAWGGIPVTADTIADRRWQAEVAGIVWQGYGIATDREAGQAKIDKEDRAVDQGLRADGSGWKCLDLASGQIVFRPTGNAEIKEIAAAVYRYVAACYAREAELMAALEAGTLTDEKLAAFWPLPIEGGEG